MSASCSGRTIRCCRITGGFPLRITGGRRRLWRVLARWFGRGVRCGRGMGRPSLLRRECSTTRSRWGCIALSAASLGVRCRWRGLRSGCSGCAFLNDWSARDIQAWEYQPLGPFLGKSFCTTVSPWIVTAEALAPFRTGLRRDEGEPAPLPYLTPPGSTFDITVEAWLGSTRLSRGSFSSLYWTPTQMIAHHASNGCNLRPGDLLGSGTISGPTAGERGCLLELTRRGAEPVALEDGSVRGFLQDGDEVVLRAYCEQNRWMGRLLHLLARDGSRMGPIKGAKKYPPPKCRRVLDNVGGRSVPVATAEARGWCHCLPRLARVPSLSPLTVVDPAWKLLFDASTPFPSRSCVKEICNHYIQKFYCKSFL